MNIPRIAVTKPNVNAGLKAGRHLPAKTADEAFIPRRIALVTEELSSSNGSGGIGGAFHELALGLAAAGHFVDIVFVPIEDHPAKRAELQIYYSAHGIGILDVPFADYVWPPLTAERKAYGLFRYFHSLEASYDFIHFHDYKGLGFYVLSAKKQTLGFNATTMIVQAHGPTRWTLEANGHPFSHEDQIKIDFMERESIARADILVSPSRYLLDWMTTQGWVLPSSRNVHVIQNLCMHLVQSTLRGASPDSPRFDGRSSLNGLQNCDEIVFFGRHEERKGIVEFCNALDELAPELTSRGVLVTFLGRFGEVHSMQSALYLSQRAVGWNFSQRILADYNRQEAAAYLAARPNALIVVASPVENSPYAVMEAIVLGRPVITSSDGGASELMDSATAAAMTCSIKQRKLAAKLHDVLQNGLPRPELAIPASVTQLAWLDLHRTPLVRPAAAPSRLPRVCVGIVHHDRPEKLVEAVLSVAAQTYRNIDITVVDDGSAKPGTAAALEKLQPLFDKLGVRVIRQPNLYLGAARNRMVCETDGEYLLFLDDDDIAFPTMVQTLVAAAEATGSGVVNCLNLFMDEKLRASAFPFPDVFVQKVSYLPLGGPISMAPLENCFGSATSLIRRDAFDAVGGYTEIHGVGHEDYELYVRMAQAGHRIDVCPLPLYLYEVGRPSMISSTSRMKNFNRVAEAVQFKGFGEQACADMISLLAGKRAQEHSDNSRDYTISISPHAATLRQVLSVAPTSLAYAERMAGYASDLAATQFSKAMAELATARASPTSVDAAPPSWAIRRPAWPQPTRSDDVLLLGAIVDLECGRTADAAAGLILSLTRHSGLNTCGIRLLKGLSESSSLSKSALVSLNEALSHVTLQDAAFASAAPYLFSLGLRDDNTEMLSAVSERMLQLDEQRYLETYSDVSAAVCGGTFASGLVHFTTRLEENRTGFACSSRLSAMLTTKGEAGAPDRLRGQVLDRIHRLKQPFPGPVLIAAE